MSDPQRDPASLRTRREPPAFRHAQVRRVERLGPRMVRVTVAGPDFEGLSVDEPAASVRVLLAPDGEELVTPQWNGNEFLLPDGRRPTIRTFTPRRFDPVALELDLDVVIHGGGVASGWAEGAETDDLVAVSGPGRGYVIDAAAPAFLLAGDESAIPAISQLLEALPSDTPVKVHIEVVTADARLPLPDHPAATAEWSELAPGAPPGDALVAAVRATELVPGTRVWAAGEAAGVQRIRRHLFEERGVPRDHATVRGYWKLDRTPRV